MRVDQIAIAIFLFISFQAIGQINNLNRSIVLEHTSDSTVKIISDPKESEGKKYYLTYQNGLQYDTLFFSYIYYCDSCRVKAIQIDNKGLKEVIITWYWESPLIDYSGNVINWSSNIIVTANEIWNLDTKQNIFSAISRYSLIKTTTYCNWQYSEICSYNYDFMIDDKGQVNIKNIKTNNLSDKPIFNLVKPDHQEGLYVFKNERYILQQ